MDNSKLIGKTVLSTKFGVGQVISIESMGTEERDFLVIESESNKIRNFVPVDDVQNYRFISTEEKINKIINSLDKSIKETEFESKKERINYFKEKSRNQDLDLITNLLLELSGISDRGVAENQIYVNLVESIALEHSMLTKVDLDTSRELISSKLEKVN